MNSYKRKLARDCEIAYLEGEMKGFKTAFDYGWITKEHYDELILENTKKILDLTS